MHHLPTFAHLQRLPAFFVGGEGTRDVLYEFEIVSPLGQGFDVIMLGYVDDQPETFLPDSVDTLVAIHNGPADECSPHRVEGPTDVLCSDDASMPGGRGSRVHGSVRISAPFNLISLARLTHSTANHHCPLLRTCAARAGDLHHRCLFLQRPHERPISAAHHLYRRDFWPHSHRVHRSLLRLGLG